MQVRCKPGTALASVSAIVLSVTVLLSLAAPLTPANAQPQITAEQLANLQPVDPSQIPAYATFWEWYYGRNGQTLAAPLPMNPYGPEVPVFDLGDGHFLINNGPDDLNLFQQQRQLQAEMGIMQPMDETPQLDDPTPLDAGFAPGTFYICSITVTGQVINLVLTNTMEGIEYEILSKDSLTNTGDWVSEGFVSGLSNSTPVTFGMDDRTNQLFLKARSWVSSSGSGIPDWWMMKYFGSDSTTWPGAYADLNGDGHTVIEAYSNNWDPRVPHTPPPPQNVTTMVDSTGTQVLITWTSGGGPVTSYVIERATDDDTIDMISIGTNSPSAFFFNDTPGIPLSGTAWQSPCYRVRAFFGNGTSVVSGWAQVYQSGWALNVHVGRGPMGQYYLAVPYLPPSVTAIHMYADEPDPGQSGFYVGVSNIVNGLAPLTAEQVGLILDRGFLWTQAVASNGSVFGRKWPFFFWNDFVEEVGSVPRTNLFVNASVQLKQNLRFLLRAATVNYPFGYSSDILTDFPYDDTTQYDYDPTHPESTFCRPPSSTNYEYYGFRTFSPTLNYSFLQEVRPVFENVLWRNIAFDVNDPNWGTGVSFDPDLYSGTVRTLSTPLNYQYTGAGAAPLPDMLANPTWICLGDWGFFESEVGLGSDNNGNGVVSAVQNCYGLQLNSLYLSDASSGIQLLRRPSESIDVSYYTNLFAFMPEFAEPDLRNEGYYFVSQTPFFNSQNSDNPAPRPAIPGSPDFTVSTQSPMLIAPFGQPFAVSGWAKLSINGSAGKFAYLEQYFDAALCIGADGKPTANSAGLLSPYGEFLPMMPGPAALVTMADIEHPEQRGTGVVNVIKLQLDVNHDGTMDLSYGGPDNTSQWNPFVFWVNNDYDRLQRDDADQAYYEDSVEKGPRVAGWRGLLGVTGPADGYYLDSDGNRVIPTVRDLEDFARLWVCGIDSNLLAVLPTGSTITLDWGDVGNPNPNNPTIDLFQAADQDGGIGYLTNASIASLQTNAWAWSSWFVGRLAPGGRIQLNLSLFTNSWAGNHFIWCGLEAGTGKLNLTISDAQGNALAQTSAYIQLKDIKQMYERRTVGEDPNLAPTNNAYLAREGLPQGAMPFQYGAPSDTNTPYILFVHGWNLETWLKDRFAETAYKRLYWQGYQGRFGTFRWPTRFNFKGNLLQLVTDWSQKDSFDSSEYTAYQSAAGLLNLLTQLHATYGNNLHLYAVSHGNMVCSEALRLAGTNRLVNTYVASQAAVTAHTYDSTVPNYSFIYIGPQPYVCFGAKTPNIYGDWFATNNGGAAEQIINFFNANDYALQRDVWQLNQLMKPDQRVAQSDGTWNYIYNGSTSDPAPWNHFYKYYTTAQVTNTVYFDIVNILTNRYEVMAFAAQSWTTALGATPQGGTPGVLNGVLRNVNLGRNTDPRIWPPDPNGYSAHLWHSGQFRGPYWHQQGYWSELLGPEALNLQ